MMKRTFFQLVALATLGLCLALSSLASASESIAHWADIPRQALTADGLAKVIVEFHVRDIEHLTRQSASRVLPVDEGQGRTAAKAAMAAADTVLTKAIEDVAARVLERLPAQAHRLNRSYRFLPLAALDVRPEALSRLQTDQRVKAVYLDMPIPLPEYGISMEAAPPKSGSASAPDAEVLSMADTMALVGADQAWTYGFSGNGWHVAVLDTGIRGTHEFFQGKNIVEACFSSRGDCPNGHSAMFGTGAAAHYSSIYQGNDHGTHVAGIAAGRKPDNTLSGVARDADIVAVNVFSRFSAQECNSSSPCVMSYNSDQIAGLEYVYSLRNHMHIGAVNMSLGGGQYTGFCDSSPQKTAIDLLRTANIPTAIATGNNSWCGALGSPACISSAVAVMAATKADLEANFNNWHPTVGDIFAPGATIRSATGASNTSYQYWSGTSMATPHVAGGLALMRQYRPLDSVAEQLARLSEWGPTIATPCSGGGSKPRLYVNNFPGGQTTSTIQVVAQPSHGGTVSGGGVRDNGTTVTVRATAAHGYVFAFWSEAGAVVSCHDQYKFTVADERILQANFSPRRGTYTISGDAHPAHGGTVAGSGMYADSAMVTMSAHSEAGYALRNWTETWSGMSGSCVVSTDDPFSFTARRDRNLTANMIPTFLHIPLWLLLIAD